MQEVFVSNKLSLLINNRNCGQEVSGVKRMQDCSHDRESFSLLNDVLFDSSPFLLSNRLIVLLAFEVSRLN